MQAKGIVHFGLLCLLGLSTNLAHAVTVSDLLISEVMANPAALSDARGEWFELYNPTTEVINLHEVTIGDDSSDRHRIESDLLIMPGEYLTLARYLDPGFVPDYVYDGFTLGNGADEIVFSDGIAELLRLDYGSEFDVAGRSRELAGLPMIASNYALTPESFAYGLGDIGTPGAAGSASLELSPEPLPVAVPVPPTAWLFVGGLLALFSMTSARSLPSSPHLFMSSRYVGPPRKRGSHNPLSQPVSAAAIRAS